MSLYNAAEWLLDRHVDEGRGDRVAIRHDGVSYTYADVLADAKRMQGALVELGFQQGDRIAMVVNDEPGFISLFLGAQRGGFVPIPLSTMLSAGELAPIVADSGANGLAVSFEYESHLGAVGAACPALRHAIVFGPSTHDAPDGVAVHEAASFGAPQHEPIVADTTRESQAFWLYSSGTTGVPKGVMHTHANLQATADTYAAQVLKTTPDDRFLSVAKLFFAYGLGNSLTFPFAVGATTILDSRRPTPPGVIETINGEQPTLFFASPGFTAALLDSDPDPTVMASVRATVTAGEALPGPLQRRFSERFGHPVLDGIGSTEALHIFISNTLDHQEPGTSGVAVPGYELQLRDESGSEVVDPDTPAYLHVRGDSIADGYWQRPEATAAAFLSGGWLRTGDVYVRTDAGYWMFLGRNSDMIKAGGIWVSPAEVESVLIEHDTVLEAAVVGSRDDQGLEMTVAFVVAATGRAVDAVALDRHCRDRMAAFKRPRQIVVVDELPKTATGKIQRFALRETLDAG
jgi:benzoate-CoA ligase family protein